jgi:hypothetical protein
MQPRHSIEDVVETPNYGGQISEDGKQKSFHADSQGTVKWERNYCRCDFCRSLRARWYRTVVQGQRE